MSLRRLVVAICLMVVAACSPSEERAKGVSVAASSPEIASVRQALECDCSIDETCYEEGNVDPDNSCNVCRAATSTDSWSRVDSPACTAGLTGAYFDNPTLSGSPAFTRVDGPLDFSAFGSPGEPIGEDEFSVRWTGQVAADRSDDYLFVLEADDGGRLWVNDKLLADTWNGTEDGGRIWLDAGVRYDVKVESYDLSGFAKTRLVWDTDVGNPGWQTIPKENLYAAANNCGSCDDGNACTQELCTTIGQCAHPAVDNGLACPGGGICQDGTCCIGCSDGDPCTQDICLEGGGCGHPFVSDGSPCGGGTCQTGACCPTGDLTCTAGLSATYYDNVTLSEPASFARVDPMVNLNPWTPGVPWEGDLSVRWTGEVVPPGTGTYTFKLAVNSGARLWVGCVLLIDAWDEPGNHLGEIDLVANVRYDIRVEHNRQEGEAWGQLYWWGPDAGFGIVPSQNLYAAPLTCACDDGDPTTENHCTRTSSCAYVPRLPGGCGEGVTCRAGVCGTTCDDGNPCTFDDCSAGTHTPVAAGTPCADATLCNGDEVCNGSGQCIAGSPPDVNDGNPCTQDSCDPLLGAVHTPATTGTSCSDGNACNGPETCNATGGCTAGTPPTIDDGNTCTVDACDPANGVGHTPVPNGTACSDNSVCTTDDSCQSGTCTPGNPVSVDDGNPCTLDSCDATTGVEHVAATSGTPCADGNVCNGQETCDGSGACVAGTPVVCAAIDQCHVAGTCQAATGECTNPPRTDGTSCSDNDACTAGDSCQSGTCQPGTAVAVDDGNLCTTDGCNATGGVFHNPVAAGTSCSDGDVCNGAEACTSGGACAAGTPPSIDDGNPCTADSCDPVAGPANVLVAAGTPCGTSDACHLPSTCDTNGACQLGALVNVDDGNPCTTDSCSPSQGVQHTPSPVGTACNDQTACTQNDVCDAAAACAGTPIPVDDGDLCTTDTCDPVTGVSHQTNPSCSTNQQGAAIEKRASILGRVRVCGGGPVGGYTVQVYDAPATEPPRADADVSMDSSDGSFFVRLANFPLSPPINTPPQRVLIRIVHPGYLTAYREASLRPGDVVNLGDIQLLARDPTETVITSSGGVATDSTGKFELNFPAGAVTQSIPVRITPVPDRDCFPAPLPDTTLTNFGVVLEPDGAHFEVPVEVRIRNDENLPQAACIPGGVYNSETGRWEHTGVARFVGQRFRDTITDFSPHDWNLARLYFSQRSQRKALIAFDRDDALETICEANHFATGTARETVSTPSYSRAGRDYNVTLKYDSGLASSRTRQVPSGATSITTRFAGGSPQLSSAPTFLVPRTLAPFVNTDVLAACQSDGSCEPMTSQSPRPAYRAEYCILGSCQTVTGPRAGNEAGLSIPVSVPLPLTSELRTPRSQYARFRHSITLQPDSVGFGNCGTFGVEDTLEPRIVVPGVEVGPEATIEGYEFIPHRHASPVGNGWGTGSELHRAPDGSRADLMDGNCVETFRRRPVVSQRTPSGIGGSFGVRAQALDTVTNEVLVAFAPGDVVRLEQNGTLTTVFAGLPFTDLVMNLAIARVAGERRLIVALANSLVEVSGAGGSRVIATFPVRSTEPMARPGLAVSGKYVYYTTRADELVRRIDLTDPDRVAVPITAGSTGDVRLDPTSPAQGVNIRTPRGLAPAPDGGIYVASTRRHVIYKIAPQPDGFAGPDSSVIRVLGNGSASYLDVQRVASGPEMALPEPILLSTSPTGSLLVVTGYGAAEWDPATLTGRWLALDLGYAAVNKSSVGMSFHQQSNALSLAKGTFLVQWEGGAIVVDTTAYVSSSEPLRTIRFDEQGAILTDTRVGVKVYRWLDDGKTVAGWTEERGLGGEPVAVATYVPGTTSIDTITDSTGGITDFTYDGNGKLSTIADAALRTTSLSIDASGNLTMVTLPEQRTRSYTYEEWRLESVTETDGTSTEYDYTGGYLSGITEERGGTTVMVTPEMLPPPPTATTYPGTYVDPRGNSHSYRVDTEGQVVRDTFVADGKTYDFQASYAPFLSGNFSGQTTANNLLKIAKVTLNGFQLSDTLAWNVGGNVVASGPPPGAHRAACQVDTWRYAYDANQRLTIEDPACTNAAWLYQRDASGRVTRRFDVEGKAFQFGVPTGREELYAFRPDGQLTSDAEHNITTTYSYQASTGHRLGSVDTLGVAMAYAYDAAGNRTSINDGTAPTTKTYDASNRVLTETDALGNTTVNEYGDGEHLTFTHTPDLPAGVGWTYTYDSAGRQQSVTNPEGFTVAYTYDAVGELASVTDSLSRLTSIDRDALGRIVGTLDSAGLRTAQSYPTPENGTMPAPAVLARGSTGAPPTGLTAALADGQWQIGENGIRPDGYPSDVHYYRDATFQLQFIQSSDPYRRRSSRSAGMSRPFAAPLNISESTYNASAPYNEVNDYHLWTPMPGLNNIIENSAPGGFEATFFPRTPWFEPIGTVQGFGAGSAVVNLSRDGAGRITAATGTAFSIQGGGAPLPPNTVTYRPNGQIQQLVSGSGTQNFTYDARGLVETITHSFTYSPASGGTPINTTEGTYTFGYDAVGRNTSLTYPDGHTRTQAYDRMGRLTSRCYEYAAGPTRCYGADYDAVGNPILLTDPEGQSSITYDDLNRVTEVRRITPGQPDVVETYSYNALGALSVNDGVPVDHQRPRLDGAGSASAGVPAAHAGQPVGQDAVGRVTQLRNSSFVFNGRGLLRSITDGPTQEQYSLDPWLRVSRRTRNGVHEGYVYSYHDIRNTDPVTQDAIANITATQDFTGKVTRRFLYEGIDQPLWMFDQGQLVTAYYELDAVGNVRRLRAGRRLGTGPSLPSDLGGYAYSAFGKTLSASTATPTPLVPTDSGSVPLDQQLRWQSRWYLDVAGGLYDFRARTWCPELGIFLQPDEFGYITRGGTLWSWSDQNPLAFRDPSGRFTMVSISAANVIGAVMATMAYSMVQIQMILHRDRVADLTDAVVKEVGDARARANQIFMGTYVGGMIIGQWVDRQTLKRRRIPDDENCTAHAQECFDTPLADKMVSYESVCTACLRKCQGQGFWPSSIPEGHSCDYWNYTNRFGL